MGVLRDTLGGAETGAFRAGVNLATDALLLPASASPRAYNTALALERTGVPYIQKRHGVKLRTPITEGTTFGSNPIIGQHHFNTPVAGTRYHYCFTSTAVASYSPTTVNKFTIIGPWALSAQTYHGSQSAGRYVFVANQKKIRGTTITEWGFDAPTVGTMAGAAGAAGNHNGTYELRVTFYSSVSGHESSPSATATATVTVTNQQIDWTNIPVSADSQVTHRYLYARNTATQTQFYKVGTVADNSTTTATTDTADSLALTAAPASGSRDRPPSTHRMALYRDRMFVATNTALYWSRIGEYEAFDLTYQTDSVSDDGDPITALYVDHGQLLIFKKTKLYVLVGEVGDAYSIELVDPNVGCMAHKTLVSANGWTYWWSRQGLARWNGVNAVDLIGLRTYGDPSEKVEEAYVPFACAIYDSPRSTLYMALPGPSQTRNNFIIPFNVVLEVFEAERWDPIDVCSFGLFASLADETNPDNLIDDRLIGSYNGLLFSVWNGHYDGVDADTTFTGTFTASSTSITTIEDLAATFATTDQGLKERKITIWDSSGNIYTGDVRPRITANTATTLTFTPAVAVESGATYTYVIGGPDFQFDTPWRALGDPYRKKRFEFLHLITRGNSETPTGYVEMFFDGRISLTDSKYASFSNIGQIAGWDEALWDVDVWDTPDYYAPRQRIGRTGKVYRVRIRDGQANNPMAVLGIAVQAVEQTYKR